MNSVNLKTISNSSEVLQAGAYTLNENLKNAFKALEEGYRKDKQPVLKKRKAHLIKLKRSLLQHQQPLVQALNQDYGSRPEFDSLIADILPSVQHLNYTLKNLKSWLKPERRKSGLMLTPSSIYVHKQSLGVVGVIVPWNFPVFLCLGPIVSALAAGNKVMVKLSEYTPQTNRILRDVFAPLADDITVIEGDASVASAFTKLDFAHVFFTGSTAVGKLVAKACSERLIPVTLELGGKSPVVITPNSDLEKAADAIILGKSINAGQICVAPDYVFVSKAQKEEFCQIYFERFSALYSQEKFDVEYGSIINQQQLSRLQTMLVDARDKGAKILAAEGNKVDEDKRILPPYLLTEVTDSMHVCQNEIFGPLLPVIEYESLDEAIDYINSKERPLALYIMSQNKQEIDLVVQSTHSGGVCINDTLLHVGADDAPFGGVGESGLGSYHGREGFDTFIHKRTVLTTPSWLPRTKIILKAKNLALKLLSKVFIK